MKSWRTIFVTVVSAILASSAIAAPSPCGGHGTRETMSVSTSWLAAHLSDPKLVIFSVGDKSDYDNSHIPGAQYLDYMSTHDMKSPAGLSVELPPMAQLAETFGKLGVSNDSLIVLYMSKDWMSPTARVFLTLDAMGLGSHTAILDGGFAAWHSEGRPVTTELPHIAPATLTPCPATDVIAVLSDVASNLHHPGIAIVDARDPVYYSGAQAGSGRRPGHIPGATNIYFQTLYDDKGKLKSPEALAALFQNAGVKPGDRVISYCHIGQQASAVYFVARYLGYDARMYDGSWEDWSAHKDLPAETTASASHK